VTALDETAPAGPFADFTAVEDLLDKARALEIALFTGHRGRHEPLTDAEARATIWLWLNVILPPEGASPSEYLADVYADCPDRGLLHQRMRRAVERVAGLYDGAAWSLPGLLARVERVSRPSDADLLAEVLLCESAGGAL
jgi:hypothetical protein